MSNIYIQEPPTNGKVRLPSEGRPAPAEGRGAARGRGAGAEGLRVGKACAPRGCAQPAAGAGARPLVSGRGRGEAGCCEWGGRGCAPVCAMALVWLRSAR